MIDDISEIQSDIAAIQAKIASLTPAPPASRTASGQGSSFSQALASAQASMDGTQPGVTAVPPASLGPLPTLAAPASVQGLEPLPVAHDVAQYDSLIQSSAAENGVDPDLVRAVIQTESGGDPSAVSSAGAMGLMQLMPANVQEAGVANPFDPAQNIAAGTKQLAAFLKQYNGNTTLALAAYNAGPANVQKYGGVPPFTETQRYIRKVKAAMGKG